MAAGLLCVSCKPEQTVAPVDDSCSGSKCVEEAEAALWEGRDKEAREPLLALCEEDSDAFSCFRLGDLYRDGKGGPKDLAKAAEFYEKSCEFDYKEGCERRFEVARDQGDTAVALDYATKACEGGRPYGCVAAGPMFVAEGKKEEAISSFEKGCNLGEASSCSQAGDLLYSPKGSNYDNGRALSDYISACQGYDGHGCLQAAIFFHEGIGTPVTLDKAQSNFKSACELGVKDGCRNEKLVAAAKGRQAVLSLTTEAESMEVEGLQAHAISCRMSSQGEAALREALTAVKRRKRSLDACSKDGAAVKVKWKFENGRVKEVRSRGTRKRISCVSKALKKRSMPGTGSCEAVLLLGDPTGAVEAWEKRVAKNSTK